MESPRGGTGLSLGVTPEDLYGLSPGEIQSIMGIETAADEMRLATLAQAYEMLKPPEPEEPPEQWETFTDEEGRVFRRNSVTNRLELVTGAIKPDEKFTHYRDDWGRLIKVNLESGEQTQVTGPKPSEPMTVAERMELKRTGREREWNEYLYQQPDGSYAVGLFDEGGGLKKKLRDATERDVRAGVQSDLPERRFAEDVAGNVRRAAQTIRLHKEKPAVRADIGYVNRYSVEPSGFIWVEERRPGPLKDINEAVEVKLPFLDGKQYTMEDVRAEAKGRGMSTEAVLREIYEAQKEK